MKMKTASVILLVLSAVLSVASFDLSGKAQAPLVHQAPLFSTEDLRLGRRSLELARVLTTTGLLAVSWPQEASKVKRTALEGLCHCSSHSEFQQLDGTDSILLGDGQTVRSSLATATIGHSPLALSSPLVEQVCGHTTVSAMEDLRDHVATAAQVFTEALDNLLNLSKSNILSLDAPLLSNSYGGSYHSIDSIVQASSNLEHFHVYSKPSSSQGTRNGPALQVHTDAGLFLAFVPAHSCQGDISNVDNSFYVQDTDGQLKQVNFPTNAVAIMLGTGAEQWLHTPSKLALKATRHSVKVDAGHARAWYGMMHLVPDSAVVDHTGEHQRTFAEMRQAMILRHHNKNTRTFSSDAPSAQLNDISIGCGFSQETPRTNQQQEDVSLSSTAISRRRLQHVENAEACNNVTNFYCWMSCLDIPQADQVKGYVNEGYSLYCVDPSVLASSGNRVSQALKPCTEAGTIGAAMNSNCMGSWQPTAPGIPSQLPLQNGTGTASSRGEPFCYGGTSMYMDGFQWLGTTCPIYLFPSLVLSSAGSLVLACLFTIVFGVALEWIIQRRRVTVQEFAPGYKRLLVSASFYGLQLIMGYSIMLIVMIYSIPLFLSVVAGIVGGHVLFSSPDAILPCREAKPKLDARGGGSRVEVEEDKACCSDTVSAADEGCSGNTTAHSTSYGSTVNGCAIVQDDLTIQHHLEVSEGVTPCCQHTV